MKYVLPFDPLLLPDFAEFVVFDGFMPHEADRIRDLWLEDSRDQATVSGENRYNKELRDSSVMFLQPSQTTDWIYERISSLARNCNEQRYCFDLKGFMQELQLTEYETGQFFDWHMDFHAGECRVVRPSETLQLLE